jgi:hypothetical protein
MSDKFTEYVYQELKQDLNSLTEKVQANSQVERALICDNVPAYTLATAPLAAQGGLGNGSSYVTTLWISDGRKSGEGAGLGTGVLAVYQSSTNQWLRLTDYSVVVT